jgi:uncharacterized membrane protein YvbJ
MSNKCPYCGSGGVDTEFDYKCLNCGHRFWQSKDIYEKHLKKSARRPISNYKRGKSRVLDIKKMKSRAHIYAWLGTYSLIIWVFSLIFLGISDENVVAFFVGAISFVCIIIFFTLEYSIKAKTPPQQVPPKLSQCRCHRCGKKIDNDSNFCIYCGIKVAKGGK